MRFLVPIIVGIGILIAGGNLGAESSLKVQCVTNTIINYSFLRDFDYATAVFLVRKAAHLAEYGLFAMSVNWAFERLLGEKAKYFAFFVTFFLAVWDEISQYSLSSRTGRATDVLVDMLGAMLGICLYNILRRKT